MNTSDFIAFLLTITFVLHGLAFLVIGVIRRRPYYFYLCGTFVILTAIYFIQFENWSTTIPGTRLPVTWLMRGLAAAFTLAYLRSIFREEGSWLWKLMQRRGIDYENSHRGDPSWVEHLEDVKHQNEFGKERFFSARIKNTDKR